MSSVMTLCGGNFELQWSCLKLSSTSHDSLAFMACPSIGSFVHLMDLDSTFNQFCRPSFESCLLSGGTAQVTCCLASPLISLKRLATCPTCTALMVHDLTYGRVHKISIVNCLFVLVVSTVIVWKGVEDISYFTCPTCTACRVLMVHDPVYTHMCKTSIVNRLMKLGCVSNVGFVLERSGGNLGRI
ncbi:uncharacterized protein FOMMEDRAFT_142531 [Fomitiporia mediterranea MF3/22]|uniref:uncharacterized protein n=1 Tax=Fomitiporia mediterranea (strain MF3/22) TaxID=694068 RepID=UPI000440908D|nr:uncharacterized protein FOMMEDRAFT_142531 [Fomitiporia mediterranea MF3/22]EJD00081.1 hypothetical protein FOMMEDRAFT_142531 [Fomitiporia mediterranea MF3/22]